MGGEEVVPSQHGAKRVAILRFTIDARRFFGRRIVGIDEIKFGPVREVFEDGVWLLQAHLIPTDMGNLEAGVVRTEAAALARDEAQAGLRAFL